MASFFTKSFSKHDDYMTPKYAWENIKEFIPKDKVLWEAFTGDGKSGKYLTEMGFEVIHDGKDFFAGKKGDIIVSNPPFSITKQLMGKLVEYDMPFILLMPTSKINTQYFRKNFSQHSQHKIQIIIPRKRIHFNKLVDGKTPEGWKDRCNFDCFYYCWKMELPRDIIWLGDD